MALTKAQKAAAAALQAAQSLLVQIVGFGATGGYVAKSAELVTLVTAGQVEQGPDGPNGEAAVRATAAGIAAVTPPAAGVAGFTPPAPAASQPDATKRVFSIVANVPLPETNRVGNKGKSIYPFEEMQPGHSFFIPATTETPDPAKSLTSTATSATRRYDELVSENGVPVMETVKVKAKGTFGQPDYVAAHEEQRQKRKHTRVFAIRPIADGAPWGQPGVPGAAMFRTQ